jgi:hypothetical protein
MKKIKVSWIILILSINHIFSKTIYDEFIKCIENGVIQEEKTVDNKNVYFCSNNYKYKKKGKGEGFECCRYSLFENNQGKIHKSLCVCNLNNCKCTEIINYSIDQEGFNNLKKKFTEKSMSFLSNEILGCMEVYFVKGKMDDEECYIFKNKKENNIVTEYMYYFNKNIIEKRIFFENNDGSFSQISKTKIEESISPVFKQYIQEEYKKHC